MSRKKRDYQIGLDVAEDWFDEWCEAMDIDDNVDAMKEDNADAFNDQRAKLIEAMRRGALVLDADGCAVYTPQNEKTKYRDPLTFHERTGASAMAMDRHKKGRDVAKTYAIMADMAGVPQKVFAGMVGKDCSICEALFALLMD